MATMLTLASASAAKTRAAMPGWPAMPIPTKAPVMMQPAYDWSGFYAGINGGWADDHDRRSNPAGVLNGGYDGNGGTVGGQIGYRKQMNNFVFGVEAQGNWADLTGSRANLTIPGGTIGEILADVQYDTAMLARGMKEQIDRAIKADVLKPNEGMRLLESYEQGLKTSTYLQF